MLLPICLVFTEERFTTMHLKIGTVVFGNSINKNQLRGTNRTRKLKTNIPAPDEKIKVEHHLVFLAKINYTNKPNVVKSFQR